MSTLHKAGRAVLSGFGIALVAALALVSGRASGDISAASEQSDEASYGEATEALLAMGRFACVTGGQFPSTLEVHDNPGGAPSCVIVNFEEAGVDYTYCSVAGVRRICGECTNLGNSLGCRY